MITLEPRTDLAVEKIENTDKQLKGIESTDYIAGSIKVTRTRITTQDACKRIGKPIGEYVTADIPDISGSTEEYGDISAALADEISSLLPKNFKTALVIGLGNRDITPDALGPKTAESILATRHITPETARDIGLADLKSVAVLSPGVLGQTGIEVGEIILGISQRIQPDAVITVDALAALNTSRLCRTVQISNTGITPGSGVGNSRFEISSKTLGIPVIAIGIPTVVCADAIAHELGTDIPTGSAMKNMIVTPSDIDAKIEHSARLLGFSVCRALQPQISFETLYALT